MPTVPESACAGHAGKAGGRGGWGAGRGGAGGGKIFPVSCVCPECGVFSDSNKQSLVLLPHGQATNSLRISQFLLSSLFSFISLSYSSALFWGVVSVVGTA